MLLGGPLWVVVVVGVGDRSVLVEGVCFVDTVGQCLGDLRPGFGFGVVRARVVGGCVARGGPPPGLRQWDR